MTGRHAAGATYPAHSRGRLTPDAVRATRFRPVSRLGRGVEPEEAQRFVDQVADDMASLYDELAEVYSENHRIKAALHAWQAEQAESAHKLPNRLR